MVVQKLTLQVRLVTERVKTVMFGVNSLIRLTFCFDLRKETKNAMLKKTITAIIITSFFIGTGCSNVGKPSNKYKGKRVNASGDMRR